MCTDIIKKETNLLHLNWTEKMNSSGTAGCFLKSKSENSRGINYYKLSNYDSYQGIFGHECINELIASRVLTVLGINHLEYKLVNARINIDGKEYVTWLSKSQNFRKPGETKQALDMFYDLNKIENESPLDLCKRYGWDEYIQQMMLADFIIINRDRHGANIEVLRNKTGEYRLAPLFDNGLSFVFSCYDDEKAISEFEVSKDFIVNNFLGTRSLEKNLKFINKNIKVNPIDENDKKYIFDGLDKIISNKHIEKIWDIIWERWNCYENIRNSEQPY